MFGETPIPCCLSFKEPALFWAEKAPLDAGRAQGDAGGPLISGQAPTPLGGEHRGQGGSSLSFGTVPLPRPLPTWAPNLRSSPRPGPGHPDSEVGLSGQEDKNLVEP